MQVRRASLNEVVRVKDAARFIDISGVQKYVINGSQVVHLNKRSSKGSLIRSKRRYPKMTACVACKRPLLDAVRFCSLGCKVWRFVLYFL